MVGRACSKGKEMLQALFVFARKRKKGVAEKRGLPHGDGTKESLVPGKRGPLRRGRETTTPYFIKRVRNGRVKLGLRRPGERRNLLLNKFSLGQTGNQEEVGKNLGEKATPWRGR